MAAMNTSRSWGWVARLLHWVMALMIVGIWLLGRTMVALPNTALMQKFEYYQLHKSLGLTVLALGLLRLAWRALNRTPALPAQAPAWERHAAHVSHVLLYLLILLIPVSGYLMASASTLGIPTLYFKLFQVPHLLGPNARAEAAFKWIHVQLGWLLAGLLAIHAAAALKHHFIDRDAVLSRMIKG